MKLIGKVDLCPKCDLRWVETHLPRRRSYTRLPMEKSTLKLCAEIRAEAKKMGMECRHFKGEALNGFLQLKRRKRK